MNGRKSIGALASVTVVAIAASALLAFATIDAPPLPVKHKKPLSMAVATPLTPATAPSTPPPLPVAATPTPAPPSTPPPPAAPAKPPAAAASTAPASTAPASTASSIDWPAAALDDVRSRAGAGEIPAMEEIGRRLLQGIGTAKDLQAGAGWLLRAANLGSAQSAFNVGVMYERGFVVERDSSKAAEWYRKAADAGLPTAKHNLALMLRDGKGTPRDVKAATALLLSAARQGMAASMFTLGDIYEQGDSGTKDPAAALAWFAITGEFERQTNRDGESTLAKTANQRAQMLKRTLTTAELEHAQELAQTEFKHIVSALAPPPSANTAAAPESAPESAPPPITSVSINWPKSPFNQIKAVQQGLFDLKRLRDRPDGTLGPVTRAAIRDFEKSAGLRETGEASREVYIALLSARHDIVTESPLPTPPPEVAAAPEPKPAEPTKTQPLMAEPTQAEAAKPEPQPQPQPPAEVKIDLGTPPAQPAPPISAEVAATPPPTAEPPKTDPPKPPPVAVDTAKPPSTAVEAAQPPTSAIDIPPSAPAPPPPTSAEVARATPVPDPPKTVPAPSESWPARKADQVKAIQTLLRDLRFYAKAVDGQAHGATTAAIREYQHMMGLKETGEPTKALFESLKDMRKMMAPTPAAAN